MLPLNIPKVILKTGKDKPIRNRHHWIFSGAVAHLPQFEDGECLGVYSASEEFLGWAYFNRRAKILGRMISFDERSPKDSIHYHLNKALEMRKKLLDDRKTNAFRLVNGEGDLLPGLIIDCYRDVCVVQISTLGMQRWRGDVVEWLKQQLQPRSIYEKSLLPSRKEEGLENEQGALFGEVPAAEFEIMENGVRFNVSILHGQKTGFFLDHREMRQYIRGISGGKRVLNCFSYTGGFSVYAAVGGAARVDSVDISQPAVQTAQRNMALNGVDLTTHRFFATDVFAFLREQPLDYDIVILDPPAFAKKQKDVVAACRGYKDINRISMEKMPKGSILLTSSCSYHIDEALFQTVVFQAAVEAGRTVRIIGRHQMASDHPINICHPESDYLKSLVLFVE